MKYFFKTLQYLTIFVLSVLLVTIISLFAKPVWRHFVTYPRFQKQINTFQAKVKPVISPTSLKEFKGVLHLHSFWSHDSEGSKYELTTAAKKAGISFMFLSDHPHGNRDTFPRGYKGIYDGVLIEPGSEKQGFVCWPMKDSIIIDWKIDRDTVAKQIVTSGGMLFLSHTEEEHNWADKSYQGMEIYNFHTDAKDESSILPFATNFIINGTKYRQWAYREIYDRQTSILNHWDELNKTRKIIGFSAVDVHENINIRARYLADGRVEWLGFNAKPIDTVAVNFWNRWLFSKPDPSGWIFRWMIVDTYEATFNHVVNHLFADSLSVKNISDHIIKGNHFTAFQSLADASGFCYFSVDKNLKFSGMMGDSVSVDSISLLKAVSPYPGRFTLLKDGVNIETSSGETYEFQYSGNLKKGAYRLEVEIKPDDQWIPWIYTNSIYIY